MYVSFDVYNGRYFDADSLRRLVDITLTEDVSVWATNPI